MKPQQNRLRSARRRSDSSVPLLRHLQKTRWTALKLTAEGPDAVMEMGSSAVLPFSDVQPAPAQGGDACSVLGELQKPSEEEPGGADCDDNNDVRWPGERPGTRWLAKNRTIKEKSQGIRGTRSPTWSRQWRPRWLWRLRRTCGSSSLAPRRLRPGRRRCSPRPWKKARSPWTGGGRDQKSVSGLLCNHPFLEAPSE